MRIFIPLIFGIAGVAVLVSLGLWQVERLAWKKGVLAEIDARIAADPVALPPSPTEEIHRYLPVETRGAFDPVTLRVLASLKRVGAGHRLITPLTLEDGRRVLIDRGFLPVSSQSISVPPQGMVTITGNLHWPDDLNTSTPAPDIAAGLWFARDLPAMAEVLDTLPLLIVTREMSPADPTLTALPVDSSAIPNDHLEYAITWFGLAAVWAAMTLYLLWRTFSAPQRRT